VGTGARLNAVFIYYEFLRVCETQQMADAGSVQVGVPNAYRVASVDQTGSYVSRE
jgi:hypothetical protein